MRLLFLLSKAGNVRLANLDGDVANLGCDIANLGGDVAATLEA